MLQVNSINLWWQEGVSKLRWWGFLHQDLVLGQQQRHQLSCRPTCFGWQWSLDRGSHTSRSSGQQWALRPTLGYSLRQLSPEQGSEGKNIPLIIKRQLANEIEETEHVLLVCRLHQRTLYGSWVLPLLGWSEWKQCRDWRFQRVQSHLIGPGGVNSKQPKVSRFLLIFCFKQTSLK